MRKVNDITHSTGTIELVAAYLDHVEESYGSLPDEFALCRKQITDIMVGIRMSLPVATVSKVIRIERLLVRYFLQNQLSGGFYTKLTCPAWTIQKHMKTVLREHPILEVQLSEVDWSSDPLSVTCEFIQGCETIHLNAPRLTLSAITWIKKLRIYSCKKLVLAHRDPAAHSIVAQMLEAHYPGLSVS